MPDPWLLDAVRRCLESEKLRDRQIFLLRHVHNYSPREISALPGIHMKKDAIETVIYRTTLSVADCTKKFPAAVKDFPAAGRLQKAGEL